MKHVEKGWGYEDWIHNDEKYCGKLLKFNKGKCCSVHFHKLKHETFYLQSGLLEVRTLPLELLAGSIFDYVHPEWNGLLYKTTILHPGEALTIPQLLVHQMLALEESEMFEFSTEHFDSDSYRLLKGD